MLRIIIPCLHPNEQYPDDFTFITRQLCATVSADVNAMLRATLTFRYHVMQVRHCSMLKDISKQTRALHYNLYGRYILSNLNGYRIYNLIFSKVSNVCIEYIFY